MFSLTFVNMTEAVVNGLYPGLNLFKKIYTASIFTTLGMVSNSSWGSMRQQYVCVTRYLGFLLVFKLFLVC